MSEMPQEIPSLSPGASSFLRTVKALLNDETLERGKAERVQQSWPEIMPDCPEGRQIKLRSTRGDAEAPANKTWKDALFEGLAVDGGLFMPDRLPKLPPEAIEMMRELSYQEIAYLLYRSFIPSTDIDQRTLRNMVDRAYDFAPKLEALDEDISIGRLDEGPTASFKDFAAQFLGQMLNEACEEEERSADIVVATSGDTGVAIAAAFKDQPAVNVTILYPTDGVSPVQEQQMLSFHGSNVQVIPIRGNFDDCQRMAKEVQHQRSSGDERLKNITSANSINIWRLIPQMAHFFYLATREPEKGPVRFAVPSGNAGHVFAGILAKEMGLPVEQFIVGTNANDVLANVIDGGFLSPTRPFETTSSNSMDIQVPSNLARILYHYDQQYGDGQFRLAEAMQYLKERNAYVWLERELNLWCSTVLMITRANLSNAEFTRFISLNRIQDVLNEHSTGYASDELFEALKKNNPAKELADFGFSPAALQKMRLDIWSQSYEDEAENNAVIEEVFDTTGKVLEPHGVIGVMAARSYLRDVPKKAGQTICLETMHPGKSTIYQELNERRAKQDKDPITFAQHPRLAELERQQFEKPPAMSTDVNQLIDRIHSHATTRAKIREQAGGTRGSIAQQLKPTEE